MGDGLFCKAVSVVVKCRGCEDRRTTIRLTVETYSTSATTHTKDLVVRLTDDTDPFFLYNLSIGEEDFQILKSQQGLLVDFSAFPQRFIDLLEQCISEQEKELPRFLLQLIISSPVLDQLPASLNVVETNPFKHLTHLSLKLLPGNDSEVKKYLAVCLKNLKAEKSMLEEQLHFTKEDLSKRLNLTQQALTEKSKELDKLQNEWTSHTSLITNQHTQEITAEREKALQIQTQWQLQYEQQKREMEAIHSTAVQHLERRVTELEAMNKDLTERKYKSESSIRELKAKVTALEEDYQRAKQEVLSLRRENSTLDVECHDKEKLLNQLRTRAAVLEQEVKDKEQVVTRTNDVFESTQEHKKQLEESLEQKQLQIGKLEATVKSLSEELLKANEIIKKLQGDMKKLVEKMKLRNAVTMQQEKLLGEREQSLQKERHDHSNVKQALKQKEEEAFKLQEQLDATVQKLEESKQLLKTNENVISWLNKQLNESKTALMQGVSGPHKIPTSVPSSTLPKFTAVQNNQVHFGLQPSNSAKMPAPDTRPGPSTSTPVVPPSSNKVDPPGLDMKYLQKKEGSVSVRVQKSTNVPSTVPTRSLLPKQGNPAVISAYFPGQQPRPPAS
ncbi:spindle assembly abnormal protein 6 homolog [Latimeria chalumnae]|uniref:spindle assembly abnormal protein 6 homolog n=1 Tax=Latimeria chalumnae TaxID=7897 RepID=UPI00313DC676